MAKDIKYGESSPDYFHFRIVFITAVILFAGLVGYALWSSYDSQLQVRQTARALFTGESSRRSLAVSSFFSGRVSELNNISSNGIVSYFIDSQSRADYDADDPVSRIHLNNLCNLLSDTIYAVYLEREQVFSKIVILDDNGELLADTDSECVLTRGNNVYAEYAVQRNSPLFRSGEVGGVFSILVSVPINTNSGNTGTIVGWVRVESLFEGLEFMTSSPAVGSDFLRVEDIIIAISNNSAQQSGQLLLMDVLGGDWSGLTILESGRSGRDVNYLAISSPVKGTSLSVISLVEENKIFGNIDPQKLLFFSIVLFLSIAVGCYYLVRSTIMRQIYEARISEGAVREASINKQRLMLEQEVEGRKQADLLRIKAEVRYRDIFDKAPMGIFQIGLDGKYITVNNAHAAIFGYADAEEFVRSISDVRKQIFVNFDDWDSLLRELKESGSVYGYETQCWCKDGSIVWTTRDLRFVRPQYDVPGYIEGFAIDISARKKAEKKLLRNQERLRSLFENSPVALWELDFSLLKERLDSCGAKTVSDIRELFFRSQRGVDDCVSLIKIIAANNLSLEFLGNDSCEQLQATGFSPYVVKKSWKYFRSILLDLAAGAMRHRSEFYFVRDDGKEQYFIVNLTVVPGYEDSWKQVLVTVEDISEIKHIENELRLSKEDAQRANEAKGQFLANMSHEFRTPMNAIKGMVQLIQMSELTEEQNEYLRLIKSSVDSLLVIANDILDFSKIDAGHMDLQVDALDLPLFLKEMRDIMDIGAMNKDLEVVLKAEGIPSIVEVDSMRLRQVLVNLLGNAVKFTSEGAVTLTAKLVPDIVPGSIRKVYFEVADTGMGLPEDGINALFNPFVQADLSITRKYGGTGLGLAICYRLVNLMGGTLEAKNNKDGGASFYFTLPLAECRQQNHSDAHVDMGVQEKFDYSKVKVLVAEDSRMNQILLRKIFEKNNIENFVIVENGKDAVDLFTAEDDFDIIFMDIQMPIMDGFEATRIIRKLHSPVRIVALTANNDFEYWQRCKESGMDARIIKPFNIEDLLAEFEKIS